MFFSSTATPVAVTAIITTTIITTR